MLSIKADVSHAAYRMGILEMASRTDPATRSSAVWVHMFGSGSASNIPKKPQVPGGKRDPHPACTSMQKACKKHASAVVKDFGDPASPGVLFHVLPHGSDGLFAFQVRLVRRFTWSLRLRGSSHGLQVLILGVLKLGRAPVHLTFNYI